LKKLNNHIGEWTNEYTDLVLIVKKVHHRYEDGTVKIRYRLLNKKNGIEYENRNGKLPSTFFKINKRIANT